MPSPTAKNTAVYPSLPCMRTIQSSRACRFYRFPEWQVALTQDSDSQLINSLPPGGQVLHPHQKQIKDRLIEVLKASTVHPEGAGVGDPTSEVVCHLWTVFSSEAPNYTASVWRHAPALISRFHSSGRHFPKLKISSAPPAPWQGTFSSSMSIWEESPPLAAIFREIWKRSLSTCHRRESYALCYD